MKKVLHILLFVGLFLVSFVLFLFLTFPYEVLKESLAAELSQGTGFNIRIGEMSASLPLGVKLKKIKVDTPTGGASLSLDQVDVGVGVLSFFLGRVHIDTQLTSGKGDLAIDVDFPILDLVKGSVVPSQIDFESKAFPLDQFAAFGLNFAANAPGGNPMVQPLLGAIGFSAELNGKLNLNLDAKQPTLSTGQAEISFGKAKLKLSHPSLGLPDQDFAKALVRAKVDQGTLVLDKASGFVSEELELLTEGKVTLKPTPLASLLDLKVMLKLNKGMKEKFGFVIDAVTGTATNEGQLTMQVRGPMEQPAVTTF